MLQWPIKHRDLLAVRCGTASIIYTSCRTLFTSCVPLLYTAWSSHSERISVPSPVDLKWPLQPSIPPVWSSYKPSTLFTPASLQPSFPGVDGGAPSAARTPPPTGSSHWAFCPGCCRNSRGPVHRQSPALLPIASPFTGPRFDFLLSRASRGRARLQPLQVHSRCRGIFYIRTTWILLLLNSLAHLDHVKEVKILKVVFLISQNKIIIWKPFPHVRLWSWTPSIWGTKLGKLRSRWAKISLGRVKFYLFLWTLPAFCSAH